MGQPDIAASNSTEETMKRADFGKEPEDAAKSKPAAPGTGPAVGPAAPKAVVEYIANHTVTPDDTLSGIALKYYGSAIREKWLPIYIYDRIFCEMNGATVNYHFVSGRMCCNNRANHSYGNIGELARSKFVLHQIVKNKVSWSNFVNSIKVFADAA